ncbi:MAG: hypothetical protein ACK587_05890, partial [Cyanobacteriota bacterium]
GWLKHSTYKESSKINSSWHKKSAQRRDMASATVLLAEVGSFYWTVPAPDIVNPGREGQGSISL